LITKDNLAKQNWNGCQKSCFCDSNETVEHLVLTCPFAKIVWRMIYFAYNIPSPSNINSMFGNSLNLVSKIDKARIQIGISAYVGLFGHIKITWFLTNRSLSSSCRLFVELRTGFSYERSYSRRISGRTWFLDATGSWWLLQTSFFGLLGGDTLLYYQWIASLCVSSSVDWFMYRSSLIYDCKLLITSYFKPF
jgi:hypothetical protein